MWDKKVGTEDFFPLAANTVSEARLLDSVDVYTFKR